MLDFRREKLRRIMARLEIGSKAPKFALENQVGKIVSLEDFSGERFVIYFYPADDTPGCTKEACQFNDGLSAFRKLGVKVIGVSPDGAQKHVAFRKKYGLTFDLLSDPVKKVMATYGAFGEKMMYGKRVTGVIRSTFVIGPEGTIEHAWYGVRADGHAAKVLATLTS
jgi:peroxiredoxin Q/BCP